MIDLPTLCAFLAAADLAFAAVLGAGVASRPRDGIAAWSAGLGARALAFGVFATHDVMEPGALAAGGALLSLSMTLQATALLAFAGRRLPAWVHTAALAGVTVPFALVASDGSGVVVFGGLVFAAMLGSLAFLAWTVGRSGSGLARPVLALSFGAAALVFLVRAIAAAFVADATLAFRAPNEMQATGFLAVAVAAVLSSFCYMLLHKERSDAQARRLATTDPLTGACNRRTFRELAEREMARARRGGQPLSLVMLDIDHFAALNEQHGERVGDEVLQRVVELLRGSLRQEDQIVRYGGDVFVVLLPDVAGPGAVVVAGRLRTAIAAEPLAIGPLQVSLTVSAGVAARLDEGPERLDRVVARAADALALAKRRGRDRVVALSLGRSIAA